MRPLIDYGDIIYNQPQNESFGEKLESVQYKVALAIAGAMQETSRDKIYQELGLESLNLRTWYKRLSCIFKIMKKEGPNYLINLIPKCEAAITTRNNNFPTYNCSLFKSRLLYFIRPNQSNTCNIFDPIGLKLLTRLRLGLTHLNERKFRHTFQDCLNPLCFCSLEIEDTTHYLLHYQHFSRRRYDLMNSVKSIIPNFESLTDNNRIDILLYGES